MKFSLGIIGCRVKDSGGGGGVEIRLKKLSELLSIP